MTDRGDIDLTGRVAIVTGAGGGLGRCHALALAEHGAKVVVNDLGGAAAGGGGGRGPADAVVEEIVAKGGEAVASYDSVATAEGAEGIVGAAITTWGRLDIVVSNAGILRDRTLSKLEESELREILEVHLLGSIFVARAAWSALKESGDGRLILTASAAGLWGNFGQTAYAAAKAGTVGVGLTLAQEGQRAGIKVNVLAPLARTRLTEEVFGEEVAALLDPAVVSPLVVVLCAPGSEISGEVFSVGGGRFARVATASAVGATTLPETVSVQWVQEHRDEIRELEGAAWPQGASDDMRLVVRGARAARAEADA
jgi:NAD(P)-dependent dehydrogenase (short-subunit alcohol dehydrogenase family)